MKRHAILTITGLFAILIFTVSGCDSGGGGGDDRTCPEPTLDIALCDPATATFSDPTNITNAFFPLADGTELILEGEEDGETIRLEITVDGSTEMVDGVETLVMVETEYEDGEKIEVSRNFMAQADDGTVCYFGEDVDIYENDVIISHEGQWRAGQNGNKPGIMMPANPQPGDVFYQEYAPGVAEDIGSVIAIGESIDVQAGEFDDTLTMEDCNPLEKAETDEKVYVSGIGLAIDEEAELISY